ncbi:MAG: hypothetical protein GY875_00165 [Gammaproteobacteria bacterium]|nr:hypothetical protein [Gammaproteobacteria bacterium]
MKRLFLVFCVCLQAFISSAALAWSPLDVYRSVIEPGPQCYALVAGSEGNQDENKNNEEGEEEEEEEPDCD